MTTEIMQTVDQVVALLDKFEKPIEIALVIVLCMLSRSVKAMSPTPTVDKAALKEAKQEAKAQNKAKLARKAALEEEMKSAIELYFSDKAYDDMTEEEQALYNRASAYLGGA